MIPAATLPRRRAVTLAALEASRIGPVKALLRELPLDYPGAARWLDRRLADALSGVAECWTIVDGVEVVGVTILTPKSRALKLSTIYVREESRGRGLGAMLIGQAIESARLLERDEIYVTVAEHKLDLLKPLLQSHGFTHTAVEENRYGPNRNEFVYTRLES